MTEKKKSAKDFPGEDPDGDAPAGDQKDPKGKADARSKPDPAVGPDPTVGPDPDGGKPGPKPRADRI